MQDGFRIASESIKELRAENAKLREALGSIKWIAGSRVQSSTVAQSILEELEHRAAAALAGKEGS